MDGAPFMPDRQIASSDLREHSRNGETVSNSEFVNSLLADHGDHRPPEGYSFRLPFLPKNRIQYAMAPSTQQLLKEALQLPDQQRAELVVELLDSLPSAGPGQERSDTEWLAEIERRARAAQAGTAGVSWEEARKQVLDRLPKR
jgi:putative addiction module component (TIGR02574 family)